MRKSLIALALVLGGCVTNGTHGAVVEERDALSAQVAELKTRVSSLEKERDGLSSQLKDARTRLEQLDEGARKEKTAAIYEQIGIEDGQKLRAVIKTSMGDIPCELWPEIAPITVANFVGLAEGTKEWTDPSTGKPRKDPLYNGTIFHRVIPGFMIQGGDPMGSGRGGPGYRFEDEVRRDVKFDQAGLLAMANSGPGTNGSQFFITEGERHPSHLNMKHTIFGKCETGTVKEIMSVDLGGPQRSTPTKPITISKIEIQRG